MADALSPEVMKLARETACHIYDPYSSKSAHEYVSGLFARALTADRASCQARVEELERALRIAHEGLKAGCDQYADRTFSGQEVPGDEQFPWVRKMQIGRDATLRALADRKEGDA